MAQVLKKYLIWAALAAILYGLLSYHIIFIGKSVALLKKSELTLNYTFFSVMSKKNSAIMAIDDLRYNGIGEILVEKGLMTREEYNRYMEKYEMPGEYRYY
ncbi:MAG: hypothetical protein ACQET7_14955 [Thermodesulfobacteriota bacterium]